MTESHHVVTITTPQQILYTSVPADLDPEVALRDGWDFIQRCQPILVWSDEDDARNRTAATLMVLNPSVVMALGIDGAQP